MMKQNEDHLPFHHFGDSGSLHHHDIHLEDDSSSSQEDSSTRAMNIALRSPTGTVASDHAMVMVEGGSSDPRIPSFLFSSPILRQENDASLSLMDLHLESAVTSNHTVPACYSKKVSSGKIANPTSNENRWKDPRNRVVRNLKTS
jgi:hypothetical protein